MTNQLQPGAELDRQVAVAMGWTEVRDEGGQFWGIRPCKDGTCHVPRFSTERHDAWEIIDAHPGWFWQIDNFRDFDGKPWRVRVDGQTAHGQTIAHAICLAFLAAKAG